MAIDGAFLHCLRDELKERLSDSRVDKIHQPSKEELVFLMRSRKATEHLYFSARVQSPRVQLTDISLENPAAPPMFCMLLRKRLLGARFLDVRQNGLERALYFDFEALNELGDTVHLTLAAEIMGRYSNIILIDQNGKVIDAVKRVDLTMSPVRPLLPGITYAAPPTDGAVRLPPFSEHIPALIRAVRARGGAPEKALLSCVQGLSPLVCREVICRAFGTAVTDIAACTEEQEKALTEALLRVNDALTDPNKRTPYIVYKDGKTPLDFSFLPLTQYGLLAVGEKRENYSALLDSFYAEKDAAERTARQARDVTRALQTASERLDRRLAAQEQEWRSAEKRDERRLFADLITAHLHEIPDGVRQVTLVNYYDPDGGSIAVPLDENLSAAANAQKYYKEYRKLKTAKEVLARQIEIGKEERRYLDSVADALSRAQSSRELEDLRTELEQTGYLRRTKQGKRKILPSQPLLFRSDDGFAIRVGRNNLQNDQLTLHTARRNDWWFHVKDASGSHTVILTDGKEPPETTVRQAAVLAATYSKAAASSQVPVDYTQICHVKKPSGAKPGRVIYTDQHTLYVTPDPALAERLKCE